MKLKYILAAALSLAAVIGFAQTSKTEKTSASATPAKKISALEATNFYNKTMTVTGKVARVSVRPKITYIDIDEAYPKAPFNGIIFASATNQFPNLKDLKGKNVELTGKIAEYQGKPQIVLNKSNQLVVVEKKSDESKPSESK
jgi:DNA/RNA endonuclease YhcR with UshA esterase domain